ncbi:hypothetical protein PUN28_016255 [Cardiocondyla obscurior]|uniref:Uncharacterized protein n=1 Tax=Cardiocondyla obscurior TaxID=286306 RepID=A0AAW2EWJ2_9HYME
MFAIEINGKLKPSPNLYGVDMTDDELEEDRPNIPSVLRGGGGLGKASCFGGATPRIMVAVTPPLRINQSECMVFVFYSYSSLGGKYISSTRGKEKPINNLL